MTQYTSVGIFHHPDGVAVTGDVLELKPEDAEAGLASGELVETPIAPSPPVTKPAATKE